MITVLFIGDVVGESGLDLTMDLLPRIRNDYSIDFALLNGENIRNGKGINSQIIKRLSDSDIDVITSGNHIWDGNADSSTFEQAKILLRPHNYPKINPGTGILTKTIKNNIKITVINLQGRGFLTPIDCPFNTADVILEELDKEVKVRIVDMHAESTAEKQALAWYLNGRVSAVIGTHTHVQTADDRILDQGTAYITDVGMTGPTDGVIGMDRDIAIKRFRHQTPHYYKLAQGNLRLNGVIIKIDEKSGKANSINRLNFSKVEYNGRKTD
jgi:metallophosphoesterase (TIGR00282 family)